MQITTDYLVIGGGVAGLSFALTAAEHGHVTVLTKRDVLDSATNWAQGGIAAVLSPDDSLEEHVADTLVAGAGLCHPDVVREVVASGPERIRALLELGVAFTQSDGELDLGREGGHTKRRVVHAGDITGAEVQRALVEAVRAHPNIELRERTMAIDLIDLARWGGPRRVVGAYVLDRDSGQVLSVVAHATVLASGGSGKVYLYTTNPDIATGDGVAMAYRAGARLANMEFFQFHPTCLFHPQAKSFLISEALRGEGGVLRLLDGTPFMQRHHAMADLAPRDVVARAIDFEMKRTGEECVWLDMTHHSASFLHERFPNIAARLAELGIDIARQHIPVVPAAHYQCGGVVVDWEGRASLPGLWAIGEVSFTGLHGANRLASNSLLEGLVYGYRAAQALAREPRSTPLPTPPGWDPGSATQSEEAVIVSNDWDELRRFMWNYVGIVRSDRRLRRASRRIAMLKEEIREYYWRHLVNMDLLELRNIADVAELIITSAASRRESRGLHHNLDYPSVDDAHFRGDTVVRWGAPPACEPVAEPAEE